MVNWWCVFVCTFGFADYKTHESPERPPRRLTDIVPKLTMYQAGVSKIYGLEPEDFEFNIG